MADVELNLDPLAMKTIEAEISDREEDIIELLYQAVYDNTPVNTGFLRSTTGTTYDSTTGEGSVYQTAEYAPYVEYRQEYFSRAIDSALSKADKIWTGGS